MKRLLILLTLFMGIATAKKEHIKQLENNPIPAAVQKNSCYLYNEATNKAHLWQKLQNDAQFQELQKAFVPELKKGWSQASQSKAYIAMNNYTQNYINNEIKTLGLKNIYATCQKEQNALQALFKEFNKIQPKRQMGQKLQTEFAAQKKFITEHGYVFYPRYGYIKK